MDAPWRGLSHCYECNALQDGLACPICGHRIEPETQSILIDGVERAVPQVITQGAIPWSAYLLLEQIKVEAGRGAPIERNARIAQRFTVVLLFWTLFEMLIDAYFRAAFADLPGDLGAELLRRFPNIGGRLDTLYKRTWQTTFWSDLAEQGYAKEAELLKQVQKARNAFVHGDPEAIDDALADDVIAHLEAIQRAWIGLFNLRCTGRSNRVPIWHSAISRASRSTS